MGSINDPVTLYVTSHTHSPDGTTRNDSFTQNTTLANYVADITTFATPLYTQVVNERAAAGALIRTATPAIAGTAAGGPCDLRVEAGIGIQALATPTRFHLVGQDMISDTGISTANDIRVWLTNLVARLSPVNIYTGGVNLL